MAVLYGADAVYLAGKQFGLRTASDNFSIEEMKEGVSFAHEHGKKAYLTMNIIAHNDSMDQVAPFLEEACDTGIDGIIVSDPGIFQVVRELRPGIPIHISTQTSTTNYRTVEFWHRLGAKRIILARELSLEEIREIRRKVPDAELEIFVHGAMCISYSGRCLLSNYMAGRDANQGDCAHPCRWRYYLMEEKRPGQYFPIEEDAAGTFVFNSRDLCLLPYLPEIISSGVTSLKIEGRVKSSFYVATVVKAYREAIDAFYEGNFGDTGPWMDEVGKVSNRAFTTGFLFGKPGPEAHNYETSSYIRRYDFAGLVTGYDEASGRLIVEQRNNFKAGDTVEILPPKGPFTELTLRELYDEEGNRIDSAPHPQMKVLLAGVPLFPANSIIRRKSAKEDG
ncbi:MAG TPA: U32 family peptidase [Thermoclostridium sp.]|nr:U32 family peptidase [Clostridiaceae bacterium]HOQ76407.1 U32 family peptidase [Thermoclostridium sp.]